MIIIESYVRPVVTRSFDFKNHETAARLRKSHGNLSPCRKNVSKPSPKLYYVAIHKGNLPYSISVVRQLYGKYPFTEKYNF